MPKNNSEKVFKYSKEKDRIIKYGPGRLYLFYGDEDYLKEQLLDDIKAIVFKDGETDFSYKKFSGNDFSIDDLVSAVNITPFLNDRTLVEIRDVDINKYSEQLIKCFSDIPDYCTVVIILSKDNSPDFRCKINKFISENGECFNITIQEHDDLVKWIRKRFKSENKIIDNDCIQELLFLSGNSMTGLIPEIRKIAAFSSSEIITKEEIRLCAHHIPEADVFDIINLVSDKKLEEAISKLSELIYSSDFEPAFVLSLIDTQFRRLFACAFAKSNKIGCDFLVNSGVVNSLWLAKKTYDVNIKYSKKSLFNILNICADYDFRLKNESIDALEIFKELLIVIESEFSDV